MAQGFALMGYAEAVAVRGRAVRADERRSSEGVIGESREPAARDSEVLRGSEAAFVAVACRPEFSWPCEWATATVRCETGGTFDPYAHGHEWYRGVYYHFLGPWQIAVTMHEENEWLYDPYQNTIEAHLKYGTQGVTAWPNCG